MGPNSTGTLMVLRHLNRIAIFFSIFMLYQAKAQDQKRVSPVGKTYFASAKTAYAQKNYKKAVALLNKDFNLRDANIPEGALSLAAYSYEKLKQWSNAQEAYAYLIKKRYKTINNKLVMQYKSGTANLSEAPGKLYEYYHKRAEALTQIYTSRYELLSPKLRQLYRRTALMYVAILEDSDNYEDDSYESISERLEKFDKYLKDSIYKPSWFIKSSYISWRDKLQMLFPNGQESTIESTGEGLCLGGGWRYENEFYEFNLNGCYARASMTVGKENSALTYFQKGVSSAAIIAGPSILWKPYSKGASFGVNLPFVYRTGKYTEPAGFVLKDVNIFTYGYLLEAGWRLPKWGFFTKFGKIERLSSSIWMFGIQYTL